MTELLKHYVPTLGAFFVETAPEIAISGTAANGLNTQQVRRDEIVELFGDKLRMH